jgi:hypothetical protein
MGTLIQFQKPKLGNARAAMGMLIEFRKPKRGWCRYLLFFVLTLSPWVLFLWLLWSTR